MKTLILLCAVLASANRLSAAISGTVLEQDGDVLILSTPRSDRPYFALKNYDGPNGTVGKRITFDAPKTGVYDWAGTPIELYVYPGAMPPPTPPPAKIQPQTKTNAPAPQAPTLPDSVVRADQYYQGLLNKNYALEQQASVLQTRINRRIAEKVMANVGDNVQLATIKQQRQMLISQIAQARKTDFMVRDSFKLPPYQPNTGLR